MALKLIKTILWIFITILGIFGLVMLFLSTSNNMDVIYAFRSNAEISSQFGGYFGGVVGTVFAIASMFLILLSLIQQNIESHKNQTISNFFKMLDYHRENVRQLNISDISPKNNRYEKISGRRAFVVFKMQLHELFKVVDRIIGEQGKEYTAEEIADIVYTVFYYGIDEKWANFLGKKLNMYNDGLVKKLIEEKKKSKIKIGRTNQTSLSSYFRNMYNAIKLIDNDRLLSKKEKRQYIKILRAQLSNPELYVLFFNVMSRFGKKWKDRDYINRYEIIKNIPHDYLEGYNPKDYFEKIDYEEDEINT